MVRFNKAQGIFQSGSFKEFGAAPIPLAWADTPTALQTGTVDGADNGTSFIKSQKFYEIMPYFTVLEHFSYFSPLFASARIMKKFDDQQIDAVMRAAREAGIYHKEVMSKQVGEIRTFLTTEGQGGMKTRPASSQRPVYHYYIARRVERVRCSVLPD